MAFSLVADATGELRMTVKAANNKVGAMMPEIVGFFNFVHPRNAFYSTGEPSVRVVQPCPMTIFCLRIKNPHAFLDRVFRSFVHIMTE